MKKDDPIVLPGQPGVSHRHQFFGARGTNAFSTPRKLRGGPTSCNRSADTAAYWVPTLKIRNRTMKPWLAQLYYGDGKKDRSLIKGFPPGLRMLAGKPAATRRQRVDRATWYCQTPPAGMSGREGLIEGSLFAVAHESIPTAHPYCEQPGATLAQLISFPDCWDGRRLDSGDHRRHISYSKREPRRWYATCPASHPVPMPQLLLTVHYETRGHPDSRRIQLSAGGIHSLHADFMNSWNQEVLEELVRNCINLSAC